MCAGCRSSSLNAIDASAKHLEEFLVWLLSGRRQADMPGEGRSFRRRWRSLCQVWPRALIVDFVHDVVFVDGIHVGRQAVVLIAQSPEHVLGRYGALTENFRAWATLMNKNAAPRLVVCDRWQQL